MVCIYCSKKTQIVNSRFQKKVNQTWRRHKCIGCKTVFTTIEAPQLESLWMVKDKNGIVEPFKRQKLFISIFSSLKHRKSALDDASALTSTVLQKIRPEKNKVVIDANNMIGTVYDVLKRFDKAASVYYKAYHKAE